MRFYLFRRGMIATAVALAITPAMVFGASSAPVGVNVTANVVAKCVVSATSDVAFSAYDPVEANADTGADLNGQGSVTIRCTPGNGVSIALDSGGNASGNQRRMAGPGTSFLNYNLFTDSARTTAWGDGTNGAPAQGITASANSAPRNFDIFGQVPKGQDGDVGAYSDIVQATVNF